MTLLPLLFNEPNYQFVVRQSQIHNHQVMAFVCSILSLLSYLYPVFLLYFLIFTFITMLPTRLPADTHTHSAQKQASPTPKTNVRCLMSPTKQAGQLEKNHFSLSSRHFDHLKFQIVNVC